jgi:hypothetical protein
MANGLGAAAIASPQVLGGVSSVVVSLMAVLPAVCGEVYAEAVSSCQDPHHSTPLRFECSGRVRRVGEAQLSDALN